MMGNNDPIETARPTSVSGKHKGPENHDARDTVADLMPWFATVLLHAAFVLIAILFVWVRINQTVIDPADDFVPRVGPDVKVESTRFKETKDPTEKNARPDRRSVEKVHKKSNPSESSVIKAPPLIGLNGSTSTSQNAFEVPAGGGDGEDFIGVPSPMKGARSFVFVIDASGSMIDTLPFVISELKRTLRSLTDQHSFTVLFYQNDTVTEALTPGLKSATHETKMQVFDWLDSDSLAPSGLSNPMKAIELGLRYKPQVMFLLSDNITGQGRYSINQSQLLQRVTLANTGATKINTIQFLYPDPITRIPGKKPTLELISDQTKGIYKFLSAKELGL